MKKTRRVLLCLALVSTFFMLALVAGAAPSEFDTDGDFGMFSFGNAITTPTVANGVLSFTTTGTDPQLYFENPVNINNGIVNADKAKKIEIRFASTAASAQFEIFFTSINPADGSYYCKPYQEGDTSEQSYVKNAHYQWYSGTGSLDKFITVTIDQTDIKYWKGKIKSLRIDPGATNGAQFVIDYVRFIGDEDEIVIPEKSESIKAEEALYGECLFYDDFESYNVGDVPESVFYSKLGTTALTKADQCKEIKIASGISGNDTKVIELTGSSITENQYPFIRVAYNLAEKGTYTMIADYYTTASAPKNWDFFNGYNKTDATSSRIMHFGDAVVGEWDTFNTSQDTAKVADFANIAYFGFGAQGIALDETVYIDNIRVFFKKMYTADIEGGEGAAGTAPVITFAKNDTITFPENTFSRTNYTFMGWLTNLSNNVYKPGETLNVGDITYLKLTAVWERAVPAEKTAQIIAEEKLYGECLFFDDFESYAIGDIPSSVYYSNIGEVKMTRSDQCGKIQIVDGFEGNDTKVIELTGNGVNYFYPFIRVLYTLNIKGKYTMLADMYTEAKDVLQFCFSNGYTSTANQVDKRLWHTPAASRNTWQRIETDYTLSSIEGFVKIDYFGFGANGVKSGETLYIDNIRLYFSEAKYIDFEAGNGATGTAPELDFYANSTITLPYNTFEKEGYVFAGWKSSIDGKTYREGEKITLGNVDEFTLTATWARFVPQLVKKNSIRDTDDGIQGMRFAGYVENDKKAYASEIGFIATREELLGDNELVFGEVNQDGFGISPNGVKYVYGATYDAAAGTDLVYTTDGNVFGGYRWKDIEGTFFTSIITGIPENNYADKFVVRPYALIDGEYVYGETLCRSVKEVAESAYNDGNREDYVMKIVEKTGIVPGKTICFLGDSITHGGTYIKELAQIYLDSETENGRYEFYNCGISGDTAGGAIKRLEDDVLAYNPDIVMIMFGMNDIGQNLYIKANYNEEVEAKRQTNLTNYKNNMRTIVDTFLENDVEVILCTPTPYDDVTNQVYECNIGLEKCAEFIRELAEEKGLELVDHYKNMYPLRSTKYWGASDPIHPNALGHHAMAQSIMHDLGYIDEMDFETAITNFSPINEERHTYVNNFRMFVMIERNMINGGYTTTEDKLDRAKELQAQQTSDHWRWIYQNYIDNCGRGLEMLDEVIRLTEEMAAKN